MEQQLSLSCSDDNKKVVVPENKSESVKSVRLALGLTQVQFAERLKINPNYLSMLERGTKIPSARLVESIRNLQLELSEGKNDSPIVREESAAPQIDSETVISSQKAIIESLFARLEEAQKTIAEQARTIGILAAREGGQTTSVSKRNSA
jgi:transcriptional regulator with XRE-family HTH domain